MKIQPILMSVAFVFLTLVGTSSFSKEEKRTHSQQGNKRLYRDSEAIHRHHHPRERWRKERNVDYGRRYGAKHSSDFYKRKHKERKRLQHHKHRHYKHHHHRHDRHKHDRKDFGYRQWRDHKRHGYRHRIHNDRHYYFNQAGFYFPGLGHIKHGHKHHRHCPDWHFNALVAGVVLSAILNGD